MLSGSTAINAVMITIAIVAGKIPFVSRCEATHAQSGSANLLAQSSCTLSLTNEQTLLQPYSVDSLSCFNHSLSLLSLTQHSLMWCMM